MEVGDQVPVVLTPGMIPQISFPLKKRSYKYDSEGEIPASVGKPNSPASRHSPAQ
jgi:hypothetical protein